MSVFDTPGECVWHSRWCVWHSRWVCLTLQVSQKDGTDGCHFDMVSFSQLSPLWNIHPNCVCPITINCRQPFSSLTPTATISCRPQLQNTTFFFIDTPSTLWLENQCRFLRIFFSEVFSCILLPSFKIRCIYPHLWSDYIKSKQLWIAVKVQCQKACVQGCWIFNVSWNFVLLFKQSIK